MIESNKTQIEIKNLNLSYNDFIILKDVNFTIKEHDIFIIMGSSGSGKTTLLNSIIGLKEPTSGDILINKQNLWKSEEQAKNKIMRETGVLYQSGALFSFMTLAENIALPIQRYTNFSQQEIDKLVSLKLSLVGLNGFEDFYPSELSGGMKKRASFARALALDPKIVYFDEPSSGLDPINSKLLSDLIVEINQNFGTTIVIVSHDLNLILNIGNDSIFLDPENKTIKNCGDPKKLLKNSKNDKIINFLTGGKKNDKNTE